MVTVQHFSYCGMSGIPHEFEDIQDARSFVANKLARLRRRFPIMTHVIGSEWEICEPEDCAMVPDACGVLTLKRVTFECRECGYACESKSDALACCNIDMENCDD